MRVSLLIVGAAVGAVAVGQAQAHGRHHHNRVVHGYAAPARPIPYAELDAYVGVHSRPAVEPGAYVVDVGTPTDTAAADEDRNWAASPPPPVKPRTRKSEVANPIGMMSPGSSTVQANYSHPQPY